MNVRPLSPVVGSEVEGLDLTQKLDDSTVEQLRQIYADTHVVLVRGQKLSREQLHQYVSYYWQPSSTTDGKPAWTAVSNVDKRDGAGKGVLLFHQDEAFTKDPAMGLSLYANEVSASSSPTTFASTLKAKDKLPAALRSRLENAKALQIIDTHCIEGDSTYRIKEWELDADAPLDRYPRYAHPVFYPLGDTGETVLFVSEHQTSHILDVPLEESEAMLTQCLEILYAADNTYVHHWKPGDVIVWDNIAVQHGRPEVVDSNPRDFWRLKTYNVAKLPFLANGPYQSVDE